MVGKEKNPTIKNVWMGLASLQQTPLHNGNGHKTRLSCQLKIADNGLNQRLTDVVYRAPVNCLLQKVTNLIRTAGC